MAVCYIYRHVNWMDIGHVPEIWLEEGRGKRERSQRRKNPNEEKRGLVTHKQ